MTRRLLAACIGLSVAVLAALVVPLGLSFAQGERDELLARVERDAVALAFFVEDDLDPAAADLGLDLTEVVDAYRERTGGRAVIVDATGRTLADGDPIDADGIGRNLSTRPEIAAALAGHVDSGIRSSETLGGRIVYVAVPVASGGTVDGAVRVTYPTDVVDERVQRRWLELAGLSAVTLVAATLIALVLARSVVAPLRRLETAAGRLGGGDLSVRAPDRTGPPEIRALATAFNGMATRLEELMTAQQHFVADASHQLRTPLTALRLRLGAIEAAGAARDEVDAATAEVERLSRLVDGLLALARADRAAPAAGDRIDVGAFLEERRDAWQPVAEDAGIAVEVAAAPGTTLVASRDRLAQVVDNLIANAIDASPHGGVVRLAGGTRAGRTEVHVADEGPGLAPDERSRAFDRFWRGPTARRSGGLGGSGLGLAIVRRLVEADGGTVRLGVASGGGVDAVVSYPTGG
jgi:signal transduction histidine kinase